MCLKVAGLVANSVDTDQTPHEAASDLGLHYLLRPACLNIRGKYGIILRITLGRNIRKGSLSLVQTTKMIRLSLCAV